ncbi:MAG: hypothetical protein ACI8UD_002248 [Planctomycetota bacterium]|jgi:hypothetical protein
MPPRGRYHLRLCVINDTNDLNRGWKVAGQRPSVVLVSDDELDSSTYKIDEAGITRLRKLLR